jgi:hypothetical protein
MKRVLWTVAMVVSAIAATAIPPRSVAALESCGEHCVTSGFCAASCWHCQGAPFEMTCR